MPWAFQSPPDTYIDIEKKTALPTKVEGYLRIREKWVEAAPTRSL